MMTTQAPSQRVLLVEDNAISRTFMVTALQRVPVEVDSADTFAAALALGKAQEYALWMFDAYLPDGNGIDLLQRLRSHRPDTLAIAHTAAPEPEMREQLLAAGFLDVLVKPFSMATIQTLVKKLVHGATTPAEDAGCQPLWDDEAAARALNGHHTHVAMLRELFLAELPQVSSRLEAAMRAGDVGDIRAQLHKLRASCGFVGARRLAAMVDALQEQPTSPSLHARFEHVARETRQQLPATRAQSTPA